MPKNKKSQLTEITNDVTDAVMTVGVALMTTAAVAEAVGIHGMKHEKLAPAPAQTNYNTIESEFNATAQRREREEHTPHYSGYSASQRTQSRTGKA